MGRNICRHTHGDACRTVYQKIRITAGKNNRLLLRIIKVWLKIHGIFINIRQKLHGNLG